MNNVNRVLDRVSATDLERVVEPLASYICATDRPRTALVSALRVLFREVAATNQVAAMQFRAFLEN
jgi:hypothetical protein